MLESVILVVFPLCMAIAAFSDMFSMTIPNRVSVILFLAFLMVAPFAGLGGMQILSHVGAGLAVLAVCFGLFAIGAMGGGDAKLLAASAVWFGFDLHLVSFLGTVGVYGGFLTLLVLLIRSQQTILLSLPVPIPTYLFNAKKGVPYGIAIGLAGLTCFPESALVEFAIARMQ